MPPSRRPYFRSRSGCLVCRARHKKCDERHPLCFGCEQNQLVCSWPESLKTRDNPNRALTPRLPSVQPSTLPKVLREQIPSNLLRHYICHTAPRFAGKVDPENPFVTYHLPLAWSSDLFLHAILSISASHLAYMSGKYELIAQKYYAITLNEFKRILATSSEDTFDGLTELNTALALCFFEAISCNREGALFYHLRAARTMIEKLQRKQMHLDQGCFGFCLEQYSYLSIVSNIALGFNGCNVERKTAPLEISLKNLNLGSKIYGFMFGCSHELFEMIPRIVRLATCHSFLTPSDRANKLNTSLDLLERQIENWQPSLGLQQPSVHPLPDTKQFQIAGDAYQQACLIFLHSSFHGPYPPDTHLIAKIDVLAENFLNIFARLSTDCSAWTTMMWPMIVVGSCLRTTRQRQKFAAIVDKSTFQMCVVDKTLEFIRWIWDAYDHDQTTYGPYSIGQIIICRKFNICVS